MKRTGILLAVLGVVLIAANAVMLYTQNARLDAMNSKLGQLEIQLAGIQDSVSNRNNTQRDIGEKGKEVFTPSELAEYLNIEMDRVYDMIDSPGTGIPYLLVDGEYRFGKEAIDDWLKGNITNNIGN